LIGGQQQGNVSAFQRIPATGAIQRQPIEYGTVSNIKHPPDHVHWLTTNNNCFDHGATFFRSLLCSRFQSHTSYCVFYMNGPIMQQTAKNSDNFCND